MITLPVKVKGSCYLEVPPAIVNELDIIADEPLKGGIFYARQFTKTSLQTDIKERGDARGVTGIIRRARPLSRDSTQKEVRESHVP